MITRMEFFGPLGDTATAWLVADSQPSRACVDAAKSLCAEAWGCPESQVEHANLDEPEAKVLFWRTLP